MEVPEVACEHKGVSVRSIKGYRKFITGLVVIVGATALTWIGRLPPEAWVAVTTATLALYNQANQREREMEEQRGPEM